MSVIQVHRNQHVGAMYILNENTCYLDLILGFLNTSLFVTSSNLFRHPNQDSKIIFFPTIVPIGICNRNYLVYGKYLVLSKHIKV